MTYYFEKFKTTYVKAVNNFTAEINIKVKWGLSSVGASSGHLELVPSLIVSYIFQT